MMKEQGGGCLRIISGRSFFVSVRLKECRGKRKGRMQRNRKRKSRSRYERKMQDRGVKEDSTLKICTLLD